MIKFNRNRFWAGLLIMSITMAMTRCGREQKHAIDYLGQDPPGMEAKLFAPGLVSTNANEHSPMVFSPDGTIALWAVMDSRYRGRLFEMTYEKGSWSKPGTPSFADTIADYYCPSFTPDGGGLFFSSRRKAPAGYPKGRGNRIWWVDRTADGWGTPVPLDTTVSKSREFSHSVSASGALYFTSAPDGGSDANIFWSEKTDVGYNPPEQLEDGINTTGYEDGPFIAPDETYLIFESTRPEGIEGSHDLYISFWDHQGGWTTPVNMGPKINSSAMERFPRVSPDGKYFFFASNKDQSEGKVGFDFYWIDAKVIEELRNSGSGQ